MDLNLKESQQQSQARPSADSLLQKCTEWTMARKCGDEKPREICSVVVLRSPRPDGGRDPAPEIFKTRGKLTRVATPAPLQLN